MYWVGQKARHLDCFSELVQRTIKFYLTPDKELNIATLSDILNSFLCHPIHSSFKTIRFWPTLYISWCLISIIASRASCFNCNRIGPPRDRDSYAMIVTIRVCLCCLKPKTGSFLCAFSPRLLAWDRRRLFEAALAGWQYITVMAGHHRKIDDRCFLSDDRKWRFNLRSQKRRLPLYASAVFETTSGRASNDNIDFQLIPLPASSVTSRTRK